MPKKSRLRQPPLLQCFCEHGCTRLAVSRFSPASGQPASRTRLHPPPNSIALHLVPGARGFLGGLAGLEAVRFLSPSAALNCADWMEAFLSFVPSTTSEAVSHVMPLKPLAPSAWRRSGLAPSDRPAEALRKRSPTHSSRALASCARAVAASNRRPEVAQRAAVPQILCHRSCEPHPRALAVLRGSRSLAQPRPRRAVRGSRR